jgi:hypothetical protein
MALVLHHFRTVVLAIAFALPQLAGANTPFELTRVFDIGGGGCTGETRVYDDAAVAQVAPHGLARGANAAKDSSTWKTLAARLSAEPLHFLTTVGCAPDRVAISINGKAYVLELMRVEQLGSPAVYYSDTPEAPRVTVERAGALHTINHKETDCRQQFDRVRVRVNFNNLTRVVNATAIGSCP